MGKNNTSNKIDLNSKVSIPMMCESAKYCII